MRGKSDGKQKGAENRPAYFENRNSMETEIANDMLEQFDDLFVREDYAKVTMRRFLHLIRTKSETKLLFSEGSTHKAVQIFEAALKERALPKWLKNGTLTPTQADYLFCYIVRGGAAVIQQWYEREHDRLICLPADKADWIARRASGRLVKRQRGNFARKFKKYIDTMSEWRYILY